MSEVYVERLVTSPLNVTVPEPANVSALPEAPLMPKAALSNEESPPVVSVTSSCSLTSPTLVSPPLVMVSDPKMFSGNAVSLRIDVPTVRVDVETPTCTTLPAPAGSDAMKRIVSTPDAATDVGPEDTPMMVRLAPEGRTSGDCDDSPPRSMVSTRLLKEEVAALAALAVAARTMTQTAISTTCSARGRRLTGVHHPCPEGTSNGRHPRAARSQMGARHTAPAAAPRAASLSSA